MMKILILCLVGIALSNALPQQASNRDYKDIKIVRSEIDNPGNGDYKWGYETSDQQQAQAEGTLKKLTPDAPPDARTISVQGSWSYVDTEGKKVLVEYTADEYGYREKRTYQ